MVSVQTSSVVERGFETKTIKLVFAASPRSMGIKELEQRLVGSEPGCVRVKRHV